jgi:hypothetical protein
MNTAQAEIKALREESADLRRLLTNLQGSVVLLQQQLATLEAVKAEVNRLAELKVSIALLEHSATDLKQTRDEWLAASGPCSGRSSAP